MAFRSPLSTMSAPLPVAPTTMEPALPPFRLATAFAFATAAPPLVVIAPTLMLPAVADSVTAAALDPTPTLLPAPVVVMACNVMPLAEVSVTEPDVVPVLSSAVVTMSAPVLALMPVPAAPVAVKIRLPPLVRMSSLMLIDEPVTVTTPLA